MPYFGKVITFSNVLLILILMLCTTLFSGTFLPLTSLSFFDAMSQVMDLLDSAS